MLRRRRLEAKDDEGLHPRGRRPPPLPDRQPEHLLGLYVGLARAGAAAGTVMIDGLLCLRERTSGQTSIKGGYDFAYVFLASFGARYICADAGLNWNQGTPPTLFVRVRLLDLSIRKTDGEIECRKLLQCCRNPHA